MPQEDWKTSFSREELESMGEIEPETTKPGPETPESEGTPDETETEPIPELEQKPEEGGEEKEGEPPKGEVAEPEPEEGKPVPYDRFAKIYGRAKQGERERDEFKTKLDLFKRDRDGYYERYPDERPADWQSEKATTKMPASQTPTRVLPMREMLDAVVQDPTNPSYHGRTLKDLMADGPEGIAAAQDYYGEYVESVRDSVKKAQEKEQSNVQSLKTEDEKFIDGHAQTFYKKPYADLDAIQQDKIDGIVNATLEWMKKNNRLAYKLDDAYKLMRYDESIKDASAKGASALVGHATKGTVRSIGATPTTMPSDPYAEYLSMTEADLTQKIMTMEDSKYTEFLSKASPAFRKKFPGLPYPD